MMSSIDVISAQSFFHPVLGPCLKRQLHALSVTGQLFCIQEMLPRVVRRRQWQLAGVTGKVFEMFAAIRQLGIACVVPNQAKVIIVQDHSPRPADCQIFTHLDPTQTSLLWPGRLVSRTVSALQTKQCSTRKDELWSKVLTLSLNPLLPGRRRSLCNC